MIDKWMENTILDVLDGAYHCLLLIIVRPIKGFTKSVNMVKWDLKYARLSQTDLGSSFYRWCWIEIMVNICYVLQANFGKRFIGDYQLKKESAWGGQEIVCQRTGSGNCLHYYHHWSLTKWVSIKLIIYVLKTRIHITPFIFSQRVA